MSEDEIYEVACNTCGSVWKVPMAEDWRAEHLDLERCPLCGFSWRGKSTEEISEEE